MTEWQRELVLPFRPSGQYLPYGVREAQSHWQSVAIDAGVEVEFGQVQNVHRTLCK